MRRSPPAILRLECHREKIFPPDGVPGEIVTGLRRGDLVLIRGPGWLGQRLGLAPGSTFAKTTRTTATPNRS